MPSSLFCNASLLNAEREILCLLESKTSSFPSLLALWTYRELWAVAWHVSKDAPSAVHKQSKICVCDQPYLDSNSVAPGDNIYDSRGRKITPGGSVFDADGRKISPASKDVLAGRKISPGGTIYDAQGRKLSPNSLGALGLNDSQVWPLTQFFSVSFL